MLRFADSVVEIMSYFTSRIIDSSPSSESLAKLSPRASATVVLKRLPGTSATSQDYHNGDSARKKESRDVYTGCNAVRR